MTDIYAEFGVNNAVMSSSDPVEHEQNMLKLDVQARDGDDAISLEQPEETDESLEEELPEEEEGEEELPEEESEEEEPSGDDDFEALPEAPDDLKAASEALSNYSDGFTALRDQAIRNGLTEALAAQIEREYETDSGLSDGSYAALEKAGYSRHFVNSYIQGQESIAEQFVSKVVDYAGGQDKFQKILAHMRSSSPEAVESLNEAMERQDLKAIRTIINLGIQGQAKKFGKAPARNVTKAAPSVPAQRRAPSVEGYASKAEMVRDMGKPEYRNDPEYRAKVEARVASSRF